MSGPDRWSPERDGIPLVSNRVFSDGVSAAQSFPSDLAAGACAATALAVSEARRSPRPASTGFARATGSAARTMQSARGHSRWGYFVTAATATPTAADTRRMSMGDSAGRSDAISSDAAYPVARPHAAPARSGTRQEAGGDHRLSRSPEEDHREHTHHLRLPAAA